MKNHKKVSRGILETCVTATLPFCLTGCMGVYENGFECPPGKGVGCKSISEVNKMVDQDQSQKIETIKQESGKERVQPPVIWFNPWADSLKSPSCSQTEGCKTKKLDV